MEFVVIGPDDEAMLGEVFAHIDDTFFRPHPFTPEEARRIARRSGLDLYAALVDGGRAIAYGMLRGWDEGFATPSLGIAVRDEYQGRGFGRSMMADLHRAALARGASTVRLRVHADNFRARRLYESLGYVYRGEDRGELVMEVDLPPGGDRAAAITPRVRLLRPDDPAWDASLVGVSRSVFHTAGYHRYARGFGEGEPYLVLVGDETRGLAWPYLLRSIAGVPGLEGTDATDVNSVYGYPGPIAWGCAPDDPFVELAWRSVVDTWRRQRAVSAFTRFHPLLGNAALVRDLTAGQGEGAGEGVIAAGSTVSVDLTLDDVGVRAGYGRDLLRQINAARREGLTTVHDEAWLHLPTFSRIYHETMTRLGAAGFYYFAEHDFERLRSSLGGSLHLLATLSDGRVAAAGLFMEHEGTVEWHLVGSDEAFRDLSPTKVLVDDAIRWARDRGNRALHMGGGRGGREDSLFWFKSRFSRLRHPFHTGRWVLDRHRYDELSSARRAMLPASATLDAGYFPAYRAPLHVDRPGPDRSE